ncbi:hypothetical protein PR003_g24252 [Phytophthora rubi]|uniref:SMP-30/Gluconolactonase/LRE-like region domain-containing protein n=1 Tax=Phytophthora rubi TaxID=129364 RepID=A0A6A4CQF2_9STRA|nr:hypothetical protein PR002_g26332 [Phytophthora rubi]KAE9294461.1 hypothetical protein PR003_g24252 [Phytophthora rubi]
MAFKHLALCRPKAIEHDPELFKKRVPNVFRLVFPRKLLWQWAARRLHLVPRNRLGGRDEERVASLLVSGLMHGSSPRFRRQEQTLYFVDMFGKKVLRYSLATESVGVVYEDVEDFVSAVGWLPDGRMLIVRMKSRQVLVLDQATGCVQLYADVSSVTQFRANELVVAASGRVYLSNAGFDLAKMRSCCSTTLVSIDPVDRQTLIVGEALVGRLTAFAINEDGTLTDRRVWAKLGSLLGGISLDAEGCVWVSVPQMGAYESRGGALVRVREGGKVTDLLGFRRNGISRRVHACTLGLDATGKVPHLYFVESVASKETAVFMHGRRTELKNSTIKRTRVAVGPALMPSNPNYCGGY